MKQDIVSEYKYNFKDDEVFKEKFEKGLNEDIVSRISEIKHEQEWLRDFRLNALKIFLEKEMPRWGADLSKIDFNEIVYYLRPVDKPVGDWNELPDGIKKTWDRLGIPEAERKFLSGVGAQYESENVYHKIRKELAEKGVIFIDPDFGLNPTDDKIKELAAQLDLNFDKVKKDILKAHEKFKEYFSRIVPVADNKFAALNSAVFSGGSFIYIPKDVKLDMNLPLQAYFRINSSSMGQFERTLIIADENSEVSYVEGCSAPIYSVKSLHSAVVEVIAEKGSRVRYTTIQNWSGDVYNLVTKRALAKESACVEWIDCNIGSAVTMKYPSVILQGDNSKADLLSLAYAGKNQVQDAGSKATHIGKNTSSRIISKSISKDGGKSTFRGIIKIGEKAENAKVVSQCDALLLDDKSKSDTLPVLQIYRDDAEMNHEASTGKIDEDKLFYMMSRGLNEDESRGLIVLGFMSPIAKTLPLEYAVELNKLIDMEMTGSVG
jgi:Fe-S cluster assembly protein SufB